VGSLRNPVGSLAPAVYWRRRVLVVAAVVVVLALILYACSGSGTGKKQPVADGKTGGPSASQSSTPASGGSSSGGPSASGSAGAPSGAPSASGGAPSGGSSAGSTSGGATGGAPGGGNGTTGPLAGGGAGCQLSLTLTNQAPAYVNGDKPQFTVAVVNKGTSDCDVDLSAKSLVLNIYSGQDRIWSSADCATGDKDLRGIAPGAVETITYSWDRSRSSAGCSAGNASAQLGMYYGVVSLAAGGGPNAPAAQSQPKTFELKSGS